MDFNKKTSETDLEYMYRICEQKDVIGTWEDVAKVLNENLNLHYDESCYRKKYQSYINMKTNLSKESVNKVDREHIDLLEQRQAELYKQQVKTRDVLREYRGTLRDEARIENILEALKDEKNEFHPEFRPYSGDYFNDNKEAILAIGDWHCGDEVHNFYNDFNLEILEQRVNNLCDKTIKYCKRNGVTHLNIINLGDMINGEIHVTCRVQNEMDTIQQVKAVSKLIYLLIIRLAENIEQVTYRSVLDNHSRINMNFKEHIEKESFAKLIDWWLESQIKNYNIAFQGFYKNPILICSDNIDDNIGHFKVGEKNIFFSHGHLGSPNTIVQDLSFATGIIADMVILGHFHTDKVKDFQGKKVYFNGTLKGVDEYALNKRLFGRPSQSLYIFEDEDDVIDIPMKF